MIKSCKKFTGTKQVEVSNAHNIRTASYCKELINGKTYIIGAAVIDDELWFAYHDQINNESYYSYAYLQKDGDNTKYSINKYLTDCRTVVYDNAIHMLGTTDQRTSSKVHVIVNNSGVSTGIDLPQIYNGSTVVVYEGKIHYFDGTTSSKDHYTWQTGDSTWTKLTNGTPINMRCGLAVVRQSTNQLHILNGTSHYKYDVEVGSWVEKGTNPFNIDSFAFTAISKGSKIHVFNGYSHYVWDDSGWLDYGDLIISADKYSFPILQNNKIGIVGGYYSDRLVYYLLDY